MIIMNGRAFAESKEEMTSSLFQPINGRTCVGYAERKKHEVIFTNLQGDKIAVINKYGCLCSAHKRGNTYHYSYADIPEMGGQDYSFVQEMDDIKALAVKKVYQSGDDPIHYFMGAHNA